MSTGINLQGQPKLVSGTNIKTINGNSVLGTGNISITSTAPRSRSIDNIGFNYFWGYGFGGDLGICDLRGVPGPIDFTVLINSGTNVTINLYRSYNPDSVSAGAVLVGSCSIGSSSARTIKFTRTIITRQVSGEGYTNYFYRMLDTTSAVNDFQSLGNFPEGQYGYDNESGPQPGYPSYIVLNMPSPAVAFYKNLQYGT